MADCTDFPTPEDAKRFKNNAGSVDEFISSDSDTFVDQDGGEHITINGIETLAENQRDQFDATFQAQFTYKHIGNISDYVGDLLSESKKLNSYQYPDDSGEWYGPIQSQTFPVTIPADPTVDEGWVLTSNVSKQWVAETVSNTNLLSNHNFIIASPDDSQPAPSSTPTSYPPGYEIFSGVFANETTGILNLTYIDGRVSFSGGDFYMVVPNTGALENITEFVASVADFDGKPRTRGVSYALVGDEYRVTVGVDALEDTGGNATPLGSVKFEQGSVATGHESKSLFDIYGHPNMGIYNPKAFGCAGDGVTDDYANALRCFQAAAGREVTVTDGVFLLGSTIKLPAVLKVSGVSPKGSADVGFKSNGTHFLFEAADNVFAKYEFSGLGFDATNCLDMRATQRSTPVSGDVSKCTFIGGDGTGVAVHLHNADFFTGSENNFYNWSGVCAVVSQGWMDADTFNSNKNSTQINWHDNTFSSNQEIGFSFDVVDSCTLEKNDFGSTPIAYDIGGFQYRSRKQGSTNNYKRGVADPAVISWQGGSTFEGLGWFSHVSIDKNHYEFGGWAVYADGRNADQGVNLTIGTSDNCIFDNTSLGGYYFRRTYDSAILRPRVDFKNNTSAQCIYYELGANLSIDSTRIYSSVAGQTTVNDIVDGGGHFFLDRVNATGGFDYNDDRRPVYLNMRAQNLSAKNVEELNSITPAYNSIPERNTSPFLPFAKDGVLNTGDVIGLLSFEDIPGNRPCGIIVINVLTSIGTVCSTWAVGHDSVVRISDESATPTVYELVWNGSTKTIQLKSNAANGTSFEVNGFAMVSGVS